MAETAWQRLKTQWVYGGFLAGLLLLVLAPLLTRGLSVAGTAVFIGLIAYMLHQYEEHDDDRFRRFVNESVLQEKGNLSHTAVFVINIFGVWAVMAATLSAAEEWHPAAALVSGYFLLVNGGAHIAQAVAMRRYNPGLWTSICLFLPVGLWTLWAITAPPLPHFVAVFLIIGLHGLIILSMRSRTK